MSKTLRGINAGSTTLTATYQGVTKNLSVTVTKTSNQITVSPTTRTIYNSSGYNTATITVSNSKGTVTASSNNTGKATVTKNSNSSFTVTYVAAGSATITFTDDGGSNYTSSTATCTVTTKVDTVSSISVSTGTKSLTPGGATSITVTATYESGATSDVTSSASYSYSPNTGRVEVKPGSTVYGIYVDEVPSIDLILNDGTTDIRNWMEGYYTGYGSNDFYTPAGTLTYNGSTKYLWYCAENDPGEVVYVLTDSNDPATLISLSVEYNLNNLFTNSIVAVFGDGGVITYSSPTIKRIMRVVIS